MSELKVYGMNDPAVGDEYEMYKVSEVDRYIAELKDRVISMINEKKYCIGYDTQSIVGQIAKAILQHHWNYEVKLDDITQSLEASREIVNSSKQLYAQLKSDKKLSEERLYKKLRNQKYKRCLAMARWCRIHDEFTQLEGGRLGLPQRALFIEYRRKAMWWNKWHKRWLELAEKFEEAK